MLWIYFCQVGRPELYKKYAIRDYFIFLVMICSNMIVNAQTHVASFFSDGTILQQQKKYNFGELIRQEQNTCRKFMGRNLPDNHINEW